MEIVEFVHSGHVVKFEINNPNDYIQKTIKGAGRFYEEAMLMDAASILSPGDLCLDVGANLGNHTVFFAKVCRAKVISIEPNSANTELLARNLAHNHIVELVSLKLAAAGQESGLVSLEIIDPNNTGRAQVRHGSGSIELIRIDDLELDQPVKLIKVDVEGMELEVLKGARSTLERDRPAVFVEASTPSEFSAVEKFLAGIGYAQMMRFNATATYRFDSARDKDEIDRIFLRSLAALKTEVREIGMKVRRLPIIRIE